jgi:hypothetical protein
MISDKVNMVGELHVVLTDEFGNIKEEHNLTNLVVAVGKAFIASRMQGVTSAVMSHMAVGTGVVAANLSDTTTGTEIGRVALTSTTGVTTTTTNDATQYVATFGAGVGTGAITEAGLFNAASAGVLLCRTVFSVINKAALDSLTITWKVTIA